MFIVSRGPSVEGVVQFFGDIVHSFQLSATYMGEPIHCGYVVDPFREAQPAETREPVFQDEAIPVFAQQSPDSNAAVQSAFCDRLSRIMEVFYDRAGRQIVEQTLQDVLGPDIGQPFTPALAAQLVQRLAERIARRGCSV